MGIEELERWLHDDASAEQADAVVTTESSDPPEATDGAPAVAPSQPAGSSEPIVDPPAHLAEQETDDEASAAAFPTGVADDDELLPEADGSIGGEEASTEMVPFDEAEVDGDIGDVLLAKGVLEPTQLTQARKVHAKAVGQKFSEVLIDMGVEEAAVIRAVANEAGLPFERVDAESVDGRFLQRLGVDFCRNNNVLPIRESGTRVVVGVTDPQHLFVLDEVRTRLGRPIKVVLVPGADIAAVIEAFTDDEVTDMIVDDIIKDIAEDDVELVETTDDDVDLEEQAGQSPVIRFVNYLIYDAVKNGASDIHVEPQEKRLRIRYRIDGVLFEAMNPPHGMHAAIVSRLKIMANLDISERRLPQDGRIRAMVNGRKLDLRLSTLPTGQGEKAVMRILDDRSIKVSLEDLGMPPHTLDLWKHNIEQPHGIILVTGPTGSGKSTTLYASLSQMDRTKLNISTVEDPIEYHLDGINQVQVHDKIGMSFSAALRSLLRQDPDTIMVGEIRDMETSRIAVQAALTGHLVLSTLHTNDAPSSITRLINIGVEPFLIGAAVNAVLAQRLVRKICDNCKEEHKIDADTAKHLGEHDIQTDVVWRGCGCGKCHETGYSGRVGLYELLTLDDVLRDAIARNPNVTEFTDLCLQQGMINLRVDGFQKAAEGRTTVEEVLRVTHSKH